MSFLFLVLIYFLRKFVAPDIYVEYALGTNLLFGRVRLRLNPNNPKQRPFAVVLNFNDVTHA